MLSKEEFSTYRFNARYTKSQCVILFNPEVMQPSNQCISLMKAYEKLYKLPYWDQNGKLISEYKNGATIGYGHLITNIKEFDKYKLGISESQASVLFKDDIYEFIQTVRFNVKEKITQHEFDGLVMLAFNIGIHAFKKSSVLKIINGTLSKNLKDAWKAFKFSQGRINKGLMNRRDAEMNVFFNGVYFKKMKVIIFAIALFLPLCSYSKDNHSIVLKNENMLIVLDMTCSPCDIECSNINYRIFDAKKNTQVSGKAISINSGVNRNFIGYRLILPENRSYLLIENAMNDSWKIELEYKASSISNSSIDTVFDDGTC